MMINVKMRSKKGMETLEFLMSGYVGMVVLEVLLWLPGSVRDGANTEFASRRVVVAVAVIIMSKPANLCVF